MATALEKIREKLAAMENKGSNNNSSSDKNIYPFWNIDEGSTAVLRFLPDADPENVFFWVERQMIRLPFPGVKGQDEEKAVTVQVPCMEMWGDICPILTQIRPWFQDPDLEDMARKYWKKRSYIFQGLVVENPMKEDEGASIPVRRFVIGPQIFNIIKSALMDPDMENMPTDYTSGTDFRLTKTTKGKYADYSTSKWARRERSLNEEELAAIEEAGLTDLKSFLPRRPNAEEFLAIPEMFEASVNGELYDPTRWGNYYKPYGLNIDNNTPSTPSSQPSKASSVSKPVVETSPPPVEDAPAPEPVAETTASSGKASAEDILAMIRNRG